NLFQRDIKEMKDAFEQNDVYLDEIERQNDLLKDQLLEASLKHDIELIIHLVEMTKSRDSHVKTSVLMFLLNEAKNESSLCRKNKQTDNTFAKVVSNKENVIDVAVANASKAKTLLCVSSPKTRFSEKATQSKTLDTTSVASKSKIDEASASKARDKVVQIVLWVVDSGCSKHMTDSRGLYSCSKDKTPEIIKKFIAQAQLNYKAKVCKIWTDNGTEFKNATLKAYYKKLGIMQKISIARTPQQNGVVERRNRTLVEAARTMLIFLRLPEFLWAEAVATACFTQNQSIINTRHNKTPYELLRRWKPNVKYFHVFGSLCYPINDHDDHGKIKPKADIRVFIGYSETSRGFRIYNRRTKRIIETIHVKFDELTAIGS
ncbi:retrovirus-related pol polyprotein from transposon TNT 1-94, partial [Tanacetum coccineum]